jgi:DNA-binding response OmpR family regulator
VKFTPAGEITCRASRQGDAVLIQVEDTGVGISEKEQVRLFEKFIQAGDTLTNKPSGTGLGLAICKEIVERHGGRIWVESQPGQGSVFSVSLPLATESSRLPQIDLQRLLRQLQAPAAGVVDGLGREILVVDDDAAIRNLLRQELEAGGFRVSEAADGLEGVARAKELQPDLVLLDVMMPQLNGFDAAAILKNDPQTSEIPIIMLTIIEDAERGYRLGVDRYLRKPVDIGRLLGEIGSLLSQGRSQKKVMIVDNNETTLATLSDVLAAQGFQVVALTSEEECLRVAMVEKPDVIIVDRKLLERHSLVKALQFEKELENTLFFVTDPDEAAFLCAL